MNHNKPSVQLAERLLEAEQTVQQQPKLGRAQEAVSTLLRSWPNESGLYSQLKRLEDFIKVTSAEISALMPSEVNKTFIPTATDELGAIVEATAAATNRIMDSAEVFNALLGKLPPEDADKAMNAVNSIYEACSFQDITGQRVTKVVKLLREIEDRISHMVSVTGTESSQLQSMRVVPTQPENPDDALLNGPALPGQAKSQQEIDDLFSN